MKFNVELIHKPYHGEQRVITKFASSPIICDNGEGRWLEEVTILQEYRIDPVGRWRNVRFVN